MAQIYGPSYYEPWEWEAPETVKRAKAKTLGRALEFAAPTPGQRLLDVGCAQGEFADVAVERGLDVTGIDLNQEAIVRATHRVPGARFHCGEIAAVVGEEFDIVTMFDFIEHVRCPIETLSTAISLLTSRGLLLISTPQVGSVSQAALGRAWPQYREEHLNLFTVTGLQRALERAGGKIVRRRPTTKYTTANYLLGQAAAYGPRPFKAVARGLRHANGFAPMRWLVPMRFGEMLIVAQRSDIIGTVAN